MTDKSTRELIVEAADRLFYQKGFEHTSFGDIAASVQISRGNFYHHFQSKDDILDAVIAARLEQTRHMLDRWEAAGKTPVERIESFIQILVGNAAKIKRFGCPVGTLCTELAKLNHPLRPDANELFTLFRLWLRRQFEQLGHGARSDDLALHILARSQGVATLANAFQDDEFIQREVDAMCDWLIALPSPTAARKRRSK